MSPFAIAGQVLALLPGAVSLVEQALGALHRSTGASPQEAERIAANATARIRLARARRKAAP